MRLAAVEAVASLYENEDNVPALSLFSDRFVPRALKMAEDVDEEVAVAALELVKVQLG